MVVVKQCSKTSKRGHLQKLIEIADSEIADSANTVLEVEKDRQFDMSKSHQYEHLLFGSVTESELPALLHRLRGLCEYATSGGIPFVDREIGYKIGDYYAVERQPFSQLSY